MWVYHPAVAMAALAVSLIGGMALLNFKPLYLNPPRVESDGLREVLDRLYIFATNALSNTNYLASNPPQSSAAWDIRNAISREIAALSTAPPSPVTREARLLVAQQAEDEGLWFVAQYASEAYLQQALRELHSVIEETK